jgi:hypothetical protein
VIGAADGAGPAQASPLKATGNIAASRVWNSAPRRIGTKPQFSGVGGLRTYISFKYSAFQ